MDSKGVTLESALVATTVAITVPTGSSRSDVGSGVFVAPGLVITCAHVVADEAGAPRADVVHGQWQDKTLDLHVVPAWVRPWAQGTGPDLALLRVDGERPLEHPWAELRDVVRIGDDLWTYGYPEGQYRHGDSVSFRYEGRSQAAGTTLHKLSHGQAQPGLSGAPALNRRTGGVVGVVRATRDRASDLGARLVSATTIAREYGEVLASELEQVPARPWLGALTDEQIHAGRWEAPTQSLRDYLKAANKQAREYPYAVPAEIAPLLVDVYIQQKVTAKSTNREETGEQDKQHERTRKTQAVPALDLLRHRNAVLTGDAGAGKSRLFNQIVADATRKWLKPEPGVAPPDFVPVRVSATRLAETRGPLTAAVVSVLGQDLVDDLHQPLPPDLLSRPPMPGVDWLVLVDGVDEVLDSEPRQKLLARLSSAMTDHDTVRIMIASRPLLDQDLVFATIGDALFELQPFAPDQLVTFAAALFEKRGSADPLADARRFQSQVSNSSLDELCRVPLMATMTWAMYADRPDQPLPHGRTSLYERFVDMLLNEQSRRIDVNRQLTDILHGCPDAREVAANLIKQRVELIGKIASARHKGSDQPILDLALAHLTGGKPSGATDDQWRKLVQVLLIRTGLIGAKGRELVFTHHTFQEYFTASVIAAETNPNNDEGRRILEEGSRPNQQNITLFLAGKWAARFDVSDAIAWLLDRGMMQLDLAVAIVADGVPVSSQCRALLVTALGIDEPRPAATRTTRTYLRRIAPQLDDGMLRRFADKEDLDPLVRLTALLEIGRRPRHADVLSQLRSILTIPATTPEYLFETVDRLMEHGLRAEALELLMTWQKEKTWLSRDTTKIVKRLYALGAETRAREILDGILTDEEKSPDAKIPAADLLVEHDHSAGIEWLGRIATSPGVSPYQKYRCAEALANAGQSEEASRLLLSVLGDPAADELDFVWSAESLCKLGFRDKAISTLSERAHDPRIPLSGRLLAMDQLRDLAALDSTMAPLLITIRDNPTMAMSEQINAVITLGSVDGSINVVNELLRIARRPSTRPYNMQIVIEKLLELKESKGALSLLQESLHSVNFDNTQHAASELVKLGHWDEAETVLRAIVHNPHKSITQRCVSLTELTQFRRDPADIAAITAIATSPAYSVQMRLTALETLRWLPGNQWTADHLTYWSFSPAATVDQRLVTSRQADLFSRYASRPAIIASLLTDSDVPLELVLEATDEIPVDDWNGRTRDAMRTLAHRDDIPKFLRELVLGATTNALPVTERHAAYTDLARDTSQPTETRLFACGWLRNASDVDTVIAVAHEVTEQADTPATTLVTAAELLADTGQPDRAISVLRRVATNASASPLARCDAAANLLEYDEYDDALAVWREILAERNWADNGYTTALDGLARVGLVDEAVEAVRAFTTSFDQPTTERAVAAAQFSELGRHEEGIEVLTRLSATAATAAEIAAVATAYVSIDERHRATKMFRQVVLADDATEAQRTTATQVLCEHDATEAYEVAGEALGAGMSPEKLIPVWVGLAEYGYQHAAANFLRDLLYDGARPASHRIAAAIGLAKAGSWLREAISAIRVILHEPGLTAADLIAASEFLSDAGEWRTAAELLDGIDAEQLDDDLAHRLERVPARTPFYR